MGKNFKMNSVHTRNICETCLSLTTQTQEQWMNLFIYNNTDMKTISL